VPSLGADGRPERYAAIRTDITERTLAEQALLDADRRKDEFLATLAHELRNPLAAIRGAEALLPGSREDPQRFGQLTAILARQSGQLERLIDDLLDVSRITHDKIRLDERPLLLADVIDDAVDATRLLAAAAQQTIEVSLPSESIALAGDRMRLAQVFANLLDNACKYSGPGSTIELSAERDAGQAVVTVRDQGIGIPREKLASIFDLFSQVGDTTDRARGGLGIGLTLTKRLVELHGGRVEARSGGLGRGSEFVVRLPSAAADRAIRRPQPILGPVSSSERLRGRRILVVDDQADVAETLALLLETIGYEVEVAHDGPAALARVEAAAPDLVLLDIGLPGMSGHDVCRAIRRQPRGAELRVVALTGWGQDSGRQKSIEAGFDAHLVKPVDPAVLHRTLEELVGARRQGA